MNINYASIIETANRRKEALENIEVLIGSAPDALRQMTYIRDYLSSLELAWARLDHEGRKMLPPKVQEILENVNDKKILAYRILGDVQSNTAFHHGLLQLAPFAKETQ